MKRCKDCAPGSKRPAPYPGPRCATHHRARRKTVSASAHARRLTTKFGVTNEEYDRLYERQGGRCAFCPATGKTKRLAVDHDHRTGLVRGLLCGRCNYDVLGKLGDHPDVYRRIVTYLTEPPAVVHIGHRFVPTGGLQ